MTSLLFVLLSFAQGAEGWIPVQGELTDAGGQHVDGTLDVTFTLYAGETGSSVLWTETQEVTFHWGAFTAYLGEDTALPKTALQTDSPLMLGVTIVGDAEMEKFDIGYVPRAAWAGMAGDVAQIGGEVPSDFVKANGYDTPAEITTVVAENAVLPVIDDVDATCGTGNNTDVVAGTLRFRANKFEGCISTGWVELS